MIMSLDPIYTQSGLDIHVSNIRNVNIQARLRVNGI